MARKAKKSKNRKNQESSNPIPKVTIVGEGRDEWGNRYFKLTVHASSISLPPYSIKQIIKDPDALYADLSNAGANVFTPVAKKQLLQALQDREQAPPSFMVASHPGWHGRTCIVFPDKIFGKSKLPLERAFGDLDVQMLAKYRTRGTLKEWQDRIWSLCVGNSRLIFVMSLAVAPLILPLVKGPRSGGFQLYGLAETGKTGAAMAAGSFWGCHLAQGRREKGFAESWHSTTAKLEVTGLVHNHSLLIPDETKQAGKTERERAQTVVNVGMGLAEHTERERLTNLGSARSLCCYFLSTSNNSLEDLARAGGVEIDDAIRGRVVDVPLPPDGHGLYEDLHGFSSGEEFTDALKARSRRFFGTPRHAFAKRLVKDRKEDARKLKRWLERRRRQYLRRLERELNKLKGEGIVPEPLKRASGRFATTFAAGSLGIKYGIFLLTRKELLAAILSCQLDGLRSNAGATGQAQPPSTSLRAKLVEYLNHHRDEFMDLDGHRPRRVDHEFGSAPGYAATFKRDKWFYLKAEQLTQIIGSGENARLLKKELADQGLMDRTPKGRFVVQRPVFSGVKGNKRSPWLHAFKASIIAQTEV